MVTGRELDDLMRVCSRLDLFELVVAENGALLYDPLSNEEVMLAEGPCLALVERLQAAKAPGLSVGRTIIATWEPYETVVLEAIRELGLELQIIFNKGAVMVLPSTVNKATGLTAALARLELPAEQVVGVGDAENDHAFIQDLRLQRSSGERNPRPQGRGRHRHGRFPRRRRCRIDRPDHCHRSCRNGWGFARRAGQTGRYPSSIAGFGPEFTMTRRITVRPIRQKAWSWLTGLCREARKAAYNTKTQLAISTTARPAASVR